jgi:hypothetical protein
MRRVSDPVATIRTTNRRRTLKPEAVPTSSHANPVLRPAAQPTTAVASLSYVDKRTRNERAEHRTRLGSISA